MGHRIWTTIEREALLHAYPALRTLTGALSRQLDEPVEVVQAPVGRRLFDDGGRTRREIVSRILETFQQSGLIRLGRKRIEILDERALGALHRVEEA